MLERLGPVPYFVYVIGCQQQQMVAANATLLMTPSVHLLAARAALLHYTVL